MRAQEGYPFWRTGDLNSWSQGFGEHNFDFCPSCRELLQAEDGAHSFGVIVHLLTRGL